MFSKLQLLNSVARAKFEVNNIPDKSSYEWKEYFTLPKNNTVKNLGTLLPHQVDHVQTLLGSLQRNRVIADTSCAGAGKTSTSSYVVKQYSVLSNIPEGIPLFIVCPKNVMKMWYDTAQRFGNRIVSISNYEMLRTTGKNMKTKWYDMRNGYVDKATVCPWISKSETMDGIKFTWNLPYKCFIIFDEEHAGKNNKTLNNSLITGAVEASKIQDHKILFLTATPIENPKQLKSLMYFLGRISTPTTAAVNEYFSSELGTTDMRIIHKFLYDKNKGVIASMPGFKPEGADQYGRNISNNIIPITLEKSDLIRETDILGNIHIELGRQKVDNTVSDKILAMITASRMYCEMLKLYKYCEFAHNALTQKRDYVDPITMEKKVLKPFQRACLFLNFKDGVTYSMQHFIEYYGYKKSDIGTIYGNQSAESVIDTIDAYNRGKIKILIATIAKAGTSVSLHDTTIGGKLETFVVISPPTSAGSLIQVMNRHFRAGITSCVTQYIPFVKGDNIEESIRNSLSLKINDIIALTSGQQCEFNISDFEKSYMEKIGNVDLAEIE